MLEQNELTQTKIKTPGLVLVVEDDPGIYTLLEMILEEAGYPVKIEVNGQAALNYIKGCSKLPSLVLLDLTMPVMDGLQFLKNLPTIMPTGQKIPIVVFSASLQTLAVEAQFGIVGNVPKPFELEEVMVYVEKYA